MLIIPPANRFPELSTLNRVVAPSAVLNVMKSPLGARSVILLDANIVSPFTPCTRSRVAFGVVVPIPILPEFCWIMKLLFPTTSPPVEMVEVAVVLVALKFPKVGVEVAVILPLLFVERSELMATPEKEMVGTENDEAESIPAVMFVLVIVPPVILGLLIVTLARLSILLVWAICW